MPYYIKVWKQDYPKSAVRRAEKAARAIDPTVALVHVHIPGNDIRVWMERPNDGNNDYNYVRERNDACIAAVEEVFARAARH